MLLAGGVLVSPVAWTQLAAYLALLLAAAWPLARAIEAVVAGRFGWGRRIEAPLYRLAGIDPDREQGLAGLRGGLAALQRPGRARRLCAAAAQAGCP